MSLRQPHMERDQPRLGPEAEERQDEDQTRDGRIGVCRTQGGKV